MMRTAAAEAVPDRARAATRPNAAIRRCAENRMDDSSRADSWIDRPRQQCYCARSEVATSNGLLFLDLEFDLFLRQFFRCRLHFGEFVVAGRQRLDRDLPERIGEF